MASTPPTPSSMPGDDEDVLTQLYRIAHDLGGPIRGMVGMSEILATDYADKFDDQGREYLGVIADCGAKARAMMDGLLHYMRVVKDATPHAPVDLAGVAAETKLLLERKITETGATIEIGVLPKVSGSVTQLQTLFTELLENALKFQEKGSKPKIVVAAKRNGHAWEITFADNGIGIASDAKERIFDLYRRLHGDDEYPGVGAGLAIARQIVARHGGRFSVGANTPKGSVFCFTLPVYGDV